MFGLWLGYRIGLRKGRQKKNATQQGSEHDNLINKKKRQPSTGQKKKDKRIGRFKLFLHGGISTLHKCSCMCNAFCVHVTYTVVTMHAICEGQQDVKRMHPGIISMPSYIFGLLNNYNQLTLWKLVSLIGNISFPVKTDILKKP